jgi:hypothetical protein
LLRGRGRTFKKEGLTPLLDTPLKQGIKGKNRGLDPPLRHPQRFLTGVKIITREGEGSLLKEGLTPPLNTPTRLVLFPRR